MGKHGFEVGDMVKASDIENCEIIKLMNLSAKVKLPGGKNKIVPYAILEKMDGSDVDDAAETDSNYNTETAIDSKVKKGNSNKKSSKRRTTKPHYIDENGDGNGEVRETVIKGGASKPKREKKEPDEAALYLAKFDTPTKTIAGLKKHKAYEFVNKESVKKLNRDKSTIGLGMFKMRALNLLRSAIKKMNK